MNSQEGRKDSEKGFGEASRGGGALGKENGESQGHALGISLPWRALVDTFYCAASTDLVLRP